VTVDDVSILYAYNRWANRRLLSAARQLEPIAFIRDLGGSHGSVRGTFVHILYGEWVWRRRWAGASPKEVFDAEQFPSVDTLESAWHVLEHEQRAFIDALSDDRLAIEVGYTNREGSAWQYPLGLMMQHVVNHSSYHRGQVAAALRQLGTTPPATDFLVFMDDAIANRL
jgi:uncharacterized damage-inducible protein DinB